jgi:hypothetical protein
MGGQAPGTPLARVYHALAYPQLLRLLDGVARMVVPLFGHRFARIGSLYLDGASPGLASPGVASPAGSPWVATPSEATPTLSTPRPAWPGGGGGSGGTPRPSTGPRGVSLASALRALHVPSAASPAAAPAVHVGPIVSWPFFGSNRGELARREDIDRGPWATTHEYLMACAYREIRGVIRENEGKAAPHRLSLDPDEVRARACARCGGC